MTDPKMPLVSQLNEKISLSLLDKIKIEASFLSTLDEVDDILCRIWHIFAHANKEDLALISGTRFHIELIKKIFSGAYFIHCLQTLKKIRETLKSKHQSLTELNADSEYLKSAIFIKSALEIALLPIKSLIEETDPMELRGVLKDLLRLCLSADDRHGIQRIAFICNEILKETVYNHKINFSKFTPTKIFFKSLQEVAAFGQAIFVLSVQIEVVSECFLKTASSESEMSSANLSIVLNNIYDVTHLFDQTLKLTETSFNKESSLQKFIQEYVFSNEIILFRALQIISSSFHIGNFSENLLKKIAEAEHNLEILNKFAHSRLQAYSAKKEGEYEWANKVYLNTVKLLAVYAAIHPANDIKWKISVAVRELHCWILEAHEIINRWYLSDDWMMLTPFINLDLENKEVEWKGSFYVPLAGDSLFKKDKRLVETIADTILAMLNSEGGTIVIGLVEKPKDVSKNLKKYMRQRSRFTFFDLSQEFDALKISFDDVKRDLQQDIANLSGSTTGQFDDLWSIKPLNILCHDSRILLAIIEVIKMNEPFISKKDSRIFIKKRIQGSNVEVDPREEYVFSRKGIIPINSQ